jgi:hypothetical protein
MSVRSAGLLLAPLGSILHGLLGASEMSRSCTGVGVHYCSIGCKRTASGTPRLTATSILNMEVITPAILTSERCATLLEHRLHRRTIGTQRNVCWGLPVLMHAECGLIGHPTLWTHHRKRHCAWMLGRWWHRHARRKCRWKIRSPCIRRFSWVRRRRSAWRGRSLFTLNA